MDWQKNNPSVSGWAQAGGAVDAGLQAHMRRVYNYMTLSLAVSGLTAFAVAQVPALVALMAKSGLILMLVILAFMWFGFRPQTMMRISAGQAQGRFLLFSVLYGLFFAPLFLMYTGSSLAKVFFITAGMFAATSLYGYTTKKPLDKMAGFMFMGLIGVIIAAVVNIFLQSPMMHFVISGAAVIIYTGLIAWDTQWIKEGYAGRNGDEANNKLAVIGALNLYINFIGLFVHLLQFLGDRR